LWTHINSFAFSLPAQRAATVLSGLGGYYYAIIYYAQVSF